MKFLMLVFNFAAYILIGIVIFGISLFLNLRNNIIFSVVIVILGLRCICWGLKELIKKNFKMIKLFILGIFLLVGIYFIESRNVEILKSSSADTNVFSIVSNRINTTKRQNEYNEVFKTIQYENNTIFYHPNIESSLKLINEYLRQAEINTSKIFLKKEINPLKIKLDYNEDIFKQIVPNRNSVVGVFSRSDNTISIFVSDSYTDILSLSLKSADFKNTLLHEYSHYKFTQFLYYNEIPYENIPAWFNEGIAEYLGYEDVYRHDSPKEIISFKDMFNYNDWDNLSNKTNSKIYSQAHYAVSQLVMLKGEGIITEIILKAKDSSFENAFKELMGIRLEEYENSLKKDMENGWKKYYKTRHATIPVDDTAIKIECLKEYLKVNPNNKKALVDLDILYKSIKK